MNLTVTGHHVDVTSSMRQYVEGKFKRLKRHSGKLQDIQVTLTVEKARHMAEANIELAGCRLHAEATEPDMYAAIDLLVDKLDRQLIRQKEKHGDHRNAIEVPEEDVEATLEAAGVLPTDS